MLSELSNMARVVNGPILYVTAICLVMLIGITIAMVYFALKYNRRRAKVGEDIHGHNTLEIVWTVIPTLLSLTMFWYGWVGYVFMKSPPDDAIQVEVTGRMWSWNHTYANGIESPELYVPVGKAVKLNLTAMDVLHSYYIPAFKVKQDLVPGRDGLFLWFEAFETGVYHVFCAEYCGMHHSYMMTKVNVMLQEDYDEWYETEGAKIAELQEALESSSDGGDKSAALAAAGKHLASSKGCVACHSDDGSRLIGPSFKGVYGKKEIVIANGTEREITVDDDYIRKSITDSMSEIVKGYQPLMPPQEGLVTNQEIDALIEYIKSLQ